MSAPQVVLVAPIAVIEVMVTVEPADRRSVQHPNEL